MKKAASTRLLLRKRVGDKLSIVQLFLSLKRLGLSFVRGRFSAEDSTIIIELVGPKNRLREAIRVCLGIGLEAHTVPRTH